MTLLRKSILCLCFLSLANLGMLAQELSPQKAIISVERIWDRAGHSAFTDLIEFNGKLYCSFREGSSHIPGLNGTVRIIVSEDGQNWQSIAHLAEKDVDLRDPKLSVTPDDRILVVMGGSFYQGSKFLKREPKVAFSDPSGANFSRPLPVEIDRTIKSEVDWLWRVTWHEGTGYGVVYQAFDDTCKVHLVQTNDGISYTLVTTFDLDGKPNETTLRFLPDGRMVALVRQEANDKMGFIGVSSPPLQNWRWSRLAGQLGGPNFICLPNGALLCGTRDYRFDDDRKTSLVQVTTAGDFKPLLTLPGGGDTSYPGLLLQDDILYVSYYSSHEDKTAIYLAKIWLDRLLR